MLLPNFPMKTFGGKVFWRTIDPVTDGDYNRTYSPNIIGSLMHKIRHAWSTDWQEINHTHKKFTRNFIE